MLLAQRFPIERVASGIIILWGLTLILTTVCTDYKGLYAQRFFLGVLESGISPMFMMIVGSFYKKNEQAFRMGYVLNDDSSILTLTCSHSIWYSCTGYVSVVSPVINYGWGHIGNVKDSWR